MNDKYTCTLSIPEMDSEAVSAARDLFSVYTKRGVILEGEFDSFCCICSDELSHVSLNFTVDRLLYRRNWEELTGMSADQFSLRMKTYALHVMGRLVLPSIQTLLNDIRKLISLSPDEISRLDKRTFTMPGQVISFVSLLPDAESRLEPVVRSLFLCMESSAPSSQRTLPTFESLAVFDDELKLFWAEADREARLFYFPVYLWWRVTSVIPTRLREFLVTERLCLEKKGEDWYITLRKDHLKGRDRKVTYTIEGDFYRVCYQIPDDLARDIRWYIGQTKDLPPAETGTLLIPEAHQLRKEKKTRYFSAVSFVRLLHGFFHSILEEKRGFTILYEPVSGHLKPDTLEFIHPGDTRQMSMISLMEQGGTPVIAMLLAGHTQVQTSAFYFSNIRTMTRCRVFRMYQTYRQRNIRFGIYPPVPSEAEAQPLDDGGVCVNPPKEDLSECFRAVGPNGETGYCPACKAHYRHPGQSRLGTEDPYLRDTKDFSALLLLTVNTARKARGCEDGIEKTALRLKNDQDASEALLTGIRRKKENRCQGTD